MSENVNEVRLRGRLSSPAEVREIGGETTAIFRLVVRRPQPGQGQSVDVLTCVARTGLVTRACGWRPGDLLEITGSMQRRFWWTDSGTASVVEVVVDRGRRVPMRTASAEEVAAGQSVELAAVGVAGLGLDDPDRLWA